MASNPQKRFRAEHDPYNLMEGANIRPGNISRQELKNAEAGALSDNPQNSSNKTKNSKTNLRQAEQKQNHSHFINNVRGEQRNTRQNITNSTKNHQKSHFLPKNLKKISPLAIIITLLFGGAAFFYSAQSLLPAHLSALITNDTDLQFTAYSSRNTRLFKYLMDGDGQVKISNFTKKYRTFTPYLKKRLSANGIEVGNLDANGNFTANNGLSTSKTVLKYGDEIIDANSFTQKFNSDANFRDAYYTAKRGRIAGFFDKSADNFYKKTGSTRNIFKNYKSTGDDKVDADAFQKTVSDRVTGSDALINSMKSETDEDGNTQNTKNGEDIDSKNISGDTPEAKARSLVNSIAGKVSTAGVPVCSALRIANIASVTVAAAQILKASANFLSLIEPSSKTLSGQGDTSGINETYNYLNTETTSSIDYINSEGQSVTVNATGSALESAGAKLMLGQTRSQQSEIEPYSLNNITRAATRIAVGTGVTTAVCSGVMASSAILSLASSAVPGGQLAKIAVGTIAKFVGTIAFTAAVSAIISAIVPYVAKIFSENLFDDYHGIAAGNLFFQGAAISNGNISRDGSAYMPASEDRIKTQNQNTVIARATEAELDRLNRSPFDPSSTNTFLGSILSKFAFSAHSHNIFNTLTSLANTTSSSLKKLTPAASATDQELMYTSVYEDCDMLENTICDIYSFNIQAYDYSTIDISPDDPAYEAAILPNLEDDGETIKDNSELAKFINFCKNRESPWGVQDANILNALQTDGGIIVNSLPIVNDILDVINAAEDIANQKWATGEHCINSADNPRWDNEFKYYQLYIQDMRILETISDSNDETNSAYQSQEITNPVLAYEAKYRESHPLDTSYQGTLARISGQSKEDIAYLLEFVNYSNFLANYDPSQAFSFHNDNPTKEPIFISNPKLIASHPDTVLTLKNSIHLDRRNYLI